MSRTTISSIDGLVSVGGIRTVPVLSIMLASLVQSMPWPAAAPLLPPLGFMLFISWRLMRSDLLPAWVGLPLGLWDDLYSGQPLGSAAACWTVCVLLLDAVDLRLVWRNFAMDWVLAAVGLALTLVGGALFARVFIPADLLRLVAPQFLWSLLLVPLAMRIAAALDNWRLGR